MACMLHGSLSRSHPSLGVLCVLLASVAVRRSSGLLGVADYFLSQQNTQAVVCGRANEHHWPCLTLVATAKKNETKQNKKQKQRESLRLHLGQKPHTLLLHDITGKYCFTLSPSAGLQCTRWARTEALRTSLSLQ